MAKFALCIHRSSLALIGVNSNVVGIQPLDQSWLDRLPPALYLLDRATCETDEDYLQLIPYVVLTHPTKGFFCYSRGGKSDEERLRAKLSIGLGGHVDTTPQSRTLLRHLMNEADRELAEEVGGNLHVKGFSAVIRLTENAVDRVHLGLVSFVHVEDFVAVEETGHVEGGHFVSLSELRTPEIYPRLEAWSKAIVDTL